MHVNTLIVSLRIFLVGCNVCHAFLQMLLAFDVHVFWKSMRLTDKWVSYAMRSSLLLLTPWISFPLNMVLCPLDYNLELSSFTLPQKQKALSQPLNSDFQNLKFFQDLCSSKQTASERIKQHEQTNELNKTGKFITKMNATTQTINDKPWKWTENKEAGLKHAVTNPPKSETNADNPLHHVQRLEEITKVTNISRNLLCHRFQPHI